jgi:hypothetical protein
LDLLDSQAQRIHYLARRVEIAQTAHYLADELDLLAFYLETGFNIGDWEKTGYLNIGLKSKELDPYYVGLSDGVAVRKPRLRMTDWWRGIVNRVEAARTDCWTEVAFALLSVAYGDQIKLDQQVRKLIDRIKKGLIKRRHSWAVMMSGTNTNRPYGIIAYPYQGIDARERRDMMRAMAGQLLHETRVFGVVVVGFDMNDRRGPYGAMLYMPGNADGAPEVGRILAMRPNPGDFDYHLKSPRPR